MAVLPPLPGSDSQTLQENHFDRFYLKRPQDVWSGADIEHIEEQPIVKHEHIFREYKNGYVCKKCNMGLEGNGLQLKNGHLYLENTRVI